MKTKPENKNNSNTPVAPYQKKQRIRFFSSFEEMDEADAKEMATLSPKEHLQNTTSLIKRIFTEELKNPPEKRIKFK
jgi:pyruvate dehydrogenase complex dehydrogenase (E1) component